MGEDRDDAHGAEDGGEERVTHLEHVGVASQELRAPHADDEPREDDHSDQVDTALAHELEDDPGGGESACDDERLRVGLHVAAHQEIDPQWEDGAPDDAGQVLAHRGDQLLRTELGCRTSRRFACVLTGGTRLHRFRLLPVFPNVSAPTIPFYDVPGTRAGVPARRHPLRRGRAGRRLLPHPQLHPSPLAFGPRPRRSPADLSPGCHSWPPAGNAGRPGPHPSS